MLLPAFLHAPPTLTHADVRATVLPSGLPVHRLPAQAQLTDSHAFTYPPLLVRLGLHLCHQAGQGCRVGDTQGPTAAATRAPSPRQTQPVDLLISFGNRSAAASGRFQRPAGMGRKRAA